MNMKRLILLLLVPLGLFGQGKISEMPAASTVTGSELMEVVQGGVNKKITLSQTGSTFYVPLSRTITINGTVYDLSANRSWSVGNVFTSGSYSNPSWITSLSAGKITGTLGVFQGGTGAATLTGILQGNGVGAFTAVNGAGSPGYFLRRNAGDTGYEFAQVDLSGRWDYTTASTQTWTTAQNYAMGGNNAAFLNGNWLLGPTGATIAANTRLDVRGIGTTTDNIVRFANSANTARYTLNDQGGAALAGKMSIAGTALSGSSDTDNWLNITATMPTTMTTSTYGVHWRITGAGSSSQNNQALRVDYLAGYTGGNHSSAGNFINRNAGVNTTAPTMGFTVGNTGNAMFSIGTTTGHNYGGIGQAQGGNVSVGLIGQAQTAKASASNLGVVGYALNTSNNAIAGYFSLSADGSSIPTTYSAAVSINNGSTTHDILKLQDNGTDVFAVRNGGDWYDGTTAGTAGVSAWVSNGTGAKPTWQTLSSGITNSAANNELMKSDGTNAVASGLGSSTLGDIDLGLSGTSGTTRNISAVGSGSNINIFATPKGTGQVRLRSGDTNSYLAVLNSSVGVTVSSGVFDVVATRSNFLGASFSNGVIEAARISSVEATSAAVGDGVRLGFSKLVAATQPTVIANIDAVATDITSGSVDFDLIFGTTLNGSLGERARISRTGIIVTSTDDIGSPDAAYLINRTFSSGSSNAHGYRDNTIFGRATYAYAAFDAAFTIGTGGSNNYDHAAGFQPRITFNSSGTLSNHYGMFEAFTLSGGGTVTNSYGGYFEDATGTGTIGAQYGLYVTDLAKGTTNWSVYTGSANSRFGGNVLLGGTSVRTNIITSTPKLQIEGTDASTSMISTVRNSNNTSQSYIVLGKTRGTVTGSNTIVQDGDQLGSIVFAGADGTNLIEGAAIKSLISGTPGTNDMPGELIFYTTADGASSGTERLRIKTTGRIVANSTITLKSYTVATLPTGTQGDTAFVTDALAPTYLTAVVGGGAVVTPVFYDGTNWIAY